MRIDHLAMYVEDLEKSKEFFVTFFGAVSNKLYHNTKTGLKTYFLSFEGGTRLEIMCRPKMKSLPKELYRTGYTHMAFKLGSKEKVDELSEKLQRAGYEILSGPRVTGDGYYETNILGPEGNQIEIVA